MIPVPTRAPAWVLAAGKVSTWSDPDPQPAKPGAKAQPTLSESDRELLEELEMLLELELLESGDLDGLLEFGLPKEKP